MRTTVAVAAVLIVVAAACEGGEAGGTATGDTTAPSSSDTVATSSTDAPVPATEPSSAPSPSPTSDPTTTASVTPPSTTDASVPDDPATLAAQIEADLNEGERAYIDAGADPGSPRSQAVLERYFGGTALPVVKDIFRQLVDGDLAVKPNPQTPNVIEVLSEPEPLNESRTKVQVDLCRIDAAIVYTPPAEPGAQEIIFNDRSTRITSRSTVELVDGLWILTGGTSLRPDEPGVTTCD